MSQGWLWVMFIAYPKAKRWVTSHIWMSHVTHMNESYHTSKWVMSHIWMSHVTHLNESRHTSEWVTSHIWMSHVTHMNESYHTSKWVTSHIWMSHVTHLNESSQGWFRVTCVAYPKAKRWVMSHVMSHTWMSHVTHMNESYHTSKWVMSHIWMSHVAHLNESCHTSEWVMSHIWMSHVTGLTLSDVYRIPQGKEMSHVTHIMRHVTLVYKSCLTYGVATISRLLKILGLFCRISSLL